MAATTTTAATGAWSVELGPGPSQLIEAVYGGSAGLLPARSAPVQLVLPARISLTVSPRKLPWSEIVTLSGHLEGGFVPPDGVALRLLIKLPGHARPHEPVPFRTPMDGETSSSTGNGELEQGGRLTPSR